MKFDPKNLVVKVHKNNLGSADPASGILSIAFKNAPTNYMLNDPAASGLAFHEMGELFRRVTSAKMVIDFTGIPAASAETLEELVGLNEAVTRAGGSLLIVDSMADGAGIIHQMQERLPDKGNANPLTFAQSEESAVRILQAMRTDLVGQARPGR